MKKWSYIWLVVMMCTGIASASANPEMITDMDANKKSFGRSAQLVWERVSRSAVHAWKVVRKTSDALTDKFIGKMSKPLDRSAADRKAAMLNNTLEEANRAAAAQTEKVKKANREIYNLKNEGFGSYTHSSKSESSSSSEGRFRSLD